MEEALYLIKHRVRDEVAFDVALRVLLSGGEGALADPNFRAQSYPLGYKALSPMLAGMTRCADWSAVPDHYSGRAQVATLRARVTAAFA